MMNFKRWFLTVAVVSGVLAITAAYLSREAFPPQTSHGVAPTNAPLAIYPAVKVVEVAGASGGFGPVMEAMLPAARRDGETEMLNLETGHWLPALPLAQFNNDTGALAAWIRTNGLNISGQVWPNGFDFAACVTYNLTVVPLESKSCETTPAEEVSRLLLSCTQQHGPRRLLCLASNHPELYAFRTDEGTFGMLRLVGLRDDRREVKIRYKLVRAREELVQPIAAK